MDVGSHREEPQIARAGGPAAQAGRYNAAPLNL